MIRTADMIREDLRNMSNRLHHLLFRVAHAQNPDEEANIWSSVEDLEREIESAEIALCNALDEEL